MSIYNFPPMPNVHSAQVHFAWQDDVFTKDELDLIVSIGDKLPKNNGTLMDDKIYERDPSFRKTEISWVELSEESHFIYNKLSNYINFINGKFFQFDLFGYAEDLQYTVYGADGCYNWHIDSISDPSLPPRKLSAVLMLSSPEDHEGGDLQVFTGNEPFTLERKKGRLYVFPSYVLHRVTPVTSGTRKTLVSWVSGNKFR